MRRSVPAFSKLLSQPDDYFGSTASQPCKSLIPKSFHDRKSNFRRQKTACFYNVESIAYGRVQRKADAEMRKIRAISPESSISGILLCARLLRRFGWKDLLWSY
jgi:hypothetical protein